MVSLTSAMRMNLLSLKRTSSSVSEVRNHLATGLKINSAIDNPSSYYTAVSLSNRASDLNSLLDNMGQAIQTVKAAVEGIASATAFLEQMSSIAEQAISSPVPIKGRPVEEFIKEGYKVINSEMSTSEIEALITDGAKLVLAGDMILSETLNIKAHNVVINGNGYKLNFKGSSVGESAISVSGSVEISNIAIAASGTGVCGVRPCQSQQGYCQKGAGNCRAKGKIHGGGNHIPCCRNGHIPCLCGRRDYETGGYCGGHSGGRKGLYHVCFRDQ